MAVFDDKERATRDDLANLFRVSDRVDRRRSTADKHARLKLQWTPEKIRWIQDNCLGRLHKEAVRMIVEKYGVTASAADSIIRRARDEE